MSSRSIRFWSRRHSNSCCLAIPPHRAADVVVAEPPLRREDTAIKLVFFVPSIAEARATAAMNGGALNPPEREWRFQHHLVCDGIDPEGNVIQLRQRAQ